jgi:predicted amidohydrolase
MPLHRIALANLRFPSTPEDSVQLAEDAVVAASSGGATILCFPECFVPGYRTQDSPIPPPDPAFLESAWTRIASAAARANIGVILGTERVVDNNLLATALVLGPDGARLGFQDKVQLDPSEESTYTPGTGRYVFTLGPLTFGIAICHEGWRYPETVRWAARHGAQVVFHPHYHWPDEGDFTPTSFADSRNSFFEKSMLCRAAENTIYFASVNMATPGSSTTSAVIRPDGALQAYQPYGKEGLLFADLDLATATGLLAKRLKLAQE